LVKGIGGLLASDSVQDVIVREATGALLSTSPIFGRAQARSKVLYDFQEHFFKGVPFRSFNFTHTLVPESRVQSSNIRDIITFMRYGMAPSMDGAFLQRPLVIKPKFFISEGNPNKHIPDLEYCVIKDFAVNYTPQEPYHHHIDGAPTQVNLSLQIEEMIPITRNEVANPGTGTLPTKDAGKDVVVKIKEFINKVKQDGVNEDAD